MTEHEEGHETVVHPPQSEYPEDPRDDIAPHLVSGARSALDVGCGRGGFGLTLRAALGPTARLVGLEAVEESAATAREAHGFDEVLTGWFPDALHASPERFDLICFNDVLEHLVDPGAALRAARSFLNPGGSVLAAIPNVQYAPVIVGLARGSWEYTDDGILDRTHVRFFTRRSMVALFEDSGLRVEQCVGMNSLYDTAWSTDPIAPRRLVKRAVHRALGDRSYLHFLVRGTPSS